MNIVCVDTTIASDLIGGAQLFLPDLLSGLTRKGHDVHLITNGSPNARVRQSIEATGAMLHYDLWNTRDLVDDSAPVLAKWMNKLSPDVFVVSTSADMGWAVLPMLDANIATLAVGHNDSATYYDPARHYRNFLTRAIGVSEEICRTYVRDCRIDAERVDRIPYGVEALDCPPTDRIDGPLNIIYVGRLDEQQKRISDLLSVVRRLTADNVDHKLSIVGDGEEMPTVKRELEAEIGTGRVALHGWVSGEEVIRRLRGSDLFVLTSAFEGFCISLTEAMANGCCPVVTDIKSGNKQLVRNGENGFVVPVGDIDAFVEKIEYLSKTPNKLLEFRQKAWETGRQYSVERMVDSYEKSFERAIEDARTHPRTPDPDLPLMESCRSKYPLWLRRIVAKFRS